ncbi:hypothetical protein EWM64_g8855 [Hericium alpestre]|uniref:Uncharacterized protein n=1 Tax=Hericium alpestre TaxID=135208 RepID=A0A4Y9ZKN4_9AGAM|nr:hypothetical protein EWM64_g8855 [Hericium alpestre]
MSSGYDLYFVEFELDAHGNKVLDPIWGYKLTERSQKACREYRRSIVKGREPMRDLPIHLRTDPRLPHLKPPRLQYGLAFTNQHIMDCVARYKIPLMDVPPEQHHIRICDAILKVTQLLTVACQMLIHITVPVDVENGWMIGLYDNYNWWTERLVEEEEEEVVDMIREVLKIDSSSPLQWYYDSRQP